MNKHFFDLRVGTIRSFAPLTTHKSPLNPLFSKEGNRRFVATAKQVLSEIFLPFFSKGE